MKENKASHTENKSLVKSYTTKELAVLYRVSYRIFLAWLQPFHSRLGKRVGHYYNPLQVEAIFSFLGEPDIEEDSR